MNTQISAEIKLSDAKALLNTKHIVYPGLVFIDRTTYNNLLGSKVSLTDIPSLANSFTPSSSKMSLLTHEYIKYINNRMYSIILGINHISTASALLRTQEFNYIKDKFEFDIVSPQEQGETYYEIIPVTEKDFLVVIENGFLHHITLTKDNCVSFVLACLRCIDRFKCDKSQLNRLLLNLHLNDKFIDLIRVRVG